MVLFEAFASMCTSCDGRVYMSRVPPVCEVSPRFASVSRRGALQIFSVLAGGMILKSTAQAAEARIEKLVDSLSRTRAALDACDDLITSAKWDKVRTILARDPVVHARDYVRELAEQISEDLRVPVLGMREDLMSALKLLDGAVYSNVFVGEDREILGTKVDYDTPRIYLQDAKNVLDDVIELASSV